MKFVLYNIHCHELLVSTISQEHSAQLSSMRYQNNSARLGASQCQPPRLYAFQKLNCLDSIMCLSEPTRRDLETYWFGSARLGYACFAHHTITILLFLFVISVRQSRRSNKQKLISKKCYPIQWESTAYILWVLGPRYLKKVLDGGTNRDGCRSTYLNSCVVHVMGLTFIKLQHGCIF